MYQSSNKKSKFIVTTAALSFNTFREITSLYLFRNLFGANQNILMLECIAK